MVSKYGEVQLDETGVVFIQAGRDYLTEFKPGYSPYDHPHPLACEGAFDSKPWQPTNK